MEKGAPDRGHAPLHATAAGLLDRLERQFETDRAERYGIDVELEERCDLSHPSVALVPHDIRSAPLVMAFTAFPGLRVRFRRWHIVAFPTCGCDACDETPESEIERLTFLIEHMTAGRFRERIRCGVNDGAWRESQFGSGNVRSAEEVLLDPLARQKLLALENRNSYEWRPWPRRK